LGDEQKIFADDWREALEAHYRDVVRRNDQQAEETLKGILNSVGFTDDDLRQMKLEATMRAEDLQGNFVPQLDVDVGQTSGTLQPGIDLSDQEEPGEVAQITAENAAQAEPEELLKPSEPEASEDDEINSEDDEDSPQQMSLF